MQHSRAGLRYGSNLTDAEWAILAPALPPEARCGPQTGLSDARGGKRHLLLRGGIAWQLMPDTFSLWRIVYLAWINRNRRLAKDVEATIASAEAFLYAASAILLLRRLAS